MSGTGTTSYSAELDADGSGYDQPDESAMLSSWDDEPTTSSFPPWPVVTAPRGSAFSCDADGYEKMGNRTPNMLLEVHLEKELKESLSKMGTGQIGHSYEELEYNQNTVYATKAANNTAVNAPCPPRTEKVTRVVNPVCDPVETRLSAKKQEPITDMAVEIEPERIVIRHRRKPRATPKSGTSQKPCKPLKPCEPQRPFVQQKPPEPLKPCEPQRPFVQQKPPEPLKPCEPQRPFVQQKPPEPLKPCEPQRPFVQQKPPEPLKPCEPQRPFVQHKPLEPLKPCEPQRPFVQQKPPEPLKPCETQRPSVQKKTGEMRKPSVPQRQFEQESTTVPTPASQLRGPPLLVSARHGSQPQSTTDNQRASVEERRVTGKGHMPTRHQDLGHTIQSRYKSAAETRKRQEKVKAKAQLDALKPNVALTNEMLTPLASEDDYPDQCYNEPVKYVCERGTNADDGDDFIKLGIQPNVLRRDNVNRIDIHREEVVRVKGRLLPTHPVQIWTRDALVDMFTLPHTDGRNRYIRMTSGDGCLAEIEFGILTYGEEPPYGKALLKIDSKPIEAIHFKKAYGTTRRVLFHLPMLSVNEHKGVVAWSLNLDPGYAKKNKAKKFKTLGTRYPKPPYAKSLVSFYQLGVLTKVPIGKARGMLYTMPLVRAVITRQDIRVCKRKE